MEAIATREKVTAPKLPGRPGNRGRALPPGPGRPKGVPNKITMTVRSAIEEAIQPGACHPQGLAGWLIDRARGGLGDRQIFTQLVGKVLPLQVNASVDGGIRLELGWLGGRQVGTSAAQLQQATPQVLDLQRENDGSYRIIDPQPVAQGGGTPSQVLEPSTIPDPHPPSKPGAGG